MRLLPLDLLVGLKLSAMSEEPTYAQLGKALLLSPSQAYNSVKRLQRAKLLRANSLDVDKRALKEFIIHGAKYAFPAERGALKRGVPTAASAKPLSEQIRNSGVPLVWADEQGSERGESIEPLYRSIPKIVKDDPELYQRLALLDALRVGRARERSLATKKWEELLSA
ncbi:MAG: hypothetical protein IPJ88_04705 [Myxococcales bacterium]|nr:MAG: hypothetical protein IPJ88_04705 [Myxococcales bacterium]